MRHRIRCAFRTLSCYKPSSYHPHLYPNPNLPLHNQVIQQRIRIRSCSCARTHTHTSYPPSPSRQEIRAQVSWHADLLSGLQSQIEVLKVDAAAPGHGRGATRAGAEEDEEVTRPSGGERDGGHGNGGERWRQLSLEAPNPTDTSNDSMVERPPAVMAMVEMVFQPSKVVRVLAGGENLDP